MTLYIPPDLARLMSGVCGQTPPQGDEDALWDMGAHYADMKKQVGLLQGALNHSKDTIKDSMSGAAADAYQTWAKEMVDNLNDLQGYLDDMSTTCDYAGSGFFNTKVICIFQLGLLFVLLAILPFIPFGEFAIPGVIATFTAILDAIIAALVLSLACGPLLDTLLQVWEKDSGRQKGFNDQEIADSAIEAVISGFLFGAGSVAGSFVRNAIGKLADNLLGDGLKGLLDKLGGLAGIPGKGLDGDIKSLTEELAGDLGKGLGDKAGADGGKGAGDGADGGLGKGAGDHAGGGKGAGPEGDGATPEDKVTGPEDNGAGQDDKGAGPQDNGEAGTGAKGAGAPSWLKPWTKLSVDNFTTKNVVTKWGGALAEGAVQLGQGAQAIAYSDLATGQPVDVTGAMLGSAFIGSLAPGGGGGKAPGASGLKAVASPDLGGVDSFSGKVEGGGPSPGDSADGGPAGKINVVGGASHPDGGGGASDPGSDSDSTLGGDDYTASDPGSSTSTLVHDGSQGGDDKGFTGTEQDSGPIGKSEAPPDQHESDAIEGQSGNRVEHLSQPGSAGGERILANYFGQDAGHGSGSIGSGSVGGGHEPPESVDAAGTGYGRGTPDSGTVMSGGQPSAPASGDTHVSPNAPTADTSQPHEVSATPSPASTDARPDLPRLQIPGQVEQIRTGTDSPVVAPSPAAPLSHGDLGDGVDTEGSTPASPVSPLSPQSSGPADYSRSPVSPISTSSAINGPADAEGSPTAPSSTGAADGGIRVDNSGGEGPPAAGGQTQADPASGDQPPIGPRPQNPADGAIITVSKASTSDDPQPALHAKTRDDGGMPRELPGQAQEVSHESMRPLTFGDKQPPKHSTKNEPHLVPVIDLTLPDAHGDGEHHGPSPEDTKVVSPHNQSHSPDSAAGERLDDYRRTERSEHITQVSPDTVMNQVALLSVYPEDMQGAGVTFYEATSTTHDYQAATAAQFGSGSHVVATFGRDALDMIKAVVGAMDSHPPYSSAAAFLHLYSRVLPLLDGMEEHDNGPVPGSFPDEIYLHTIPFAKVEPVLGASFSGIGDGELILNPLGSHGDVVELQVAERKLFNSVMATEIGRSVGDLLSAFNDLKHLTGPEALGVLRVTISKNADDIVEFTFDISPVREHVQPETGVWVSAKEALLNDQPTVESLEYMRRLANTLHWDPTRFETKLTEDERSAIKLSAAQSKSLAHAKNGARPGYDQTLEAFTTRGGYYLYQPDDVDATRLISSDDKPIGAIFTRDNLDSMLPWAKSKTHSDHRGYLGVMTKEDSGIHKALISGVEAEHGHSMYKAVAGWGLKEAIKHGTVKREEFFPGSNDDIVFFATHGAKEGYSIDIFGGSRATTSPADYYRLLTNHKYAAPLLQLHKNVSIITCYGLKFKSSVSLPNPLGGDRPYIVQDLANRMPGHQLSGPTGLVHSYKASQIGWPLALHQSSSWKPVKPDPTVSEPIPLAISMDAMDVQDVHSSSAGSTADTDHVMHDLPDDVTPHDEEPLEHNTFAPPRRTPRRTPARDGQGSSSRARPSEDDIRAEYNRRVTNILGMEPGPSARTVSGRKAMEEYFSPAQIESLEHLRLRHEPGTKNYVRSTDPVYGSPIILELSESGVRSRAIEYERQVGQILGEDTTQFDNLLTPEEQESSAKNFSDIQQQSLVDLRDGKRPGETGYAFGISREDHTRILFHINNLRTSKFADFVSLANLKNENLKTWLAHITSSQKYVRIAADAPDSVQSIAGALAQAAAALYGSEYDAGHFTADMFRWAINHGLLEEKELGFSRVGSIVVAEGKLGYLAELNDGTHVEIPPRHLAQVLAQNTSIYNKLKRATKFKIIAVEQPGSGDKLADQPANRNQGIVDQILAWSVSGRITASTNPLTYVELVPGHTEETSVQYLVGVNDRAGFEELSRRPVASEVDFSLDEARVAQMLGPAAPLASKMRAIHYDALASQYMKKGTRPSQLLTTTEWRKAFNYFTKAQRVSLENFRSGGRPGRKGYLMAVSPEDGTRILLHHSDLLIGTSSVGGSGEKVVTISSHDNDVVKNWMSNFRLGEKFFHVHPQADEDVRSVDDGVHQVLGELFGNEEELVTRDIVRYAVNSGRLVEQNISGGKTLVIVPSSGKFGIGVKLQDGTNVELTPSSFVKLLRLTGALVSDSSLQDIVVAASDHDPRSPIGQQDPYDKRSNPIQGIADHLPLHRVYITGPLAATSLRTGHGTSDGVLVGVDARSGFDRVHPLPLVTRTDLLLNRLRVKSLLGSSRDVPPPDRGDESHDLELGSRTVNQGINDANYRALITKLSSLPEATVAPPEDVHTESRPHPMGDDPGVPDHPGPAQSNVSRVDDVEMGESFPAGGFDPDVVHGDVGSGQGAPDFSAMDYDLDFEGDDGTRGLAIDDQELFGGLTPRPAADWLNDIEMWQPSYVGDVFDGDDLPFDQGLVDPALFSGELGGGFDLGAVFEGDTVPAEMTVDLPSLELASGAGGRDRSADDAGHGGDEGGQIAPVPVAMDVSGHEDPVVLSDRADDDVPSAQEITVEHERRVGEFLGENVQLFTCLTAERQAKVAEFFTDTQRRTLRYLEDGERPGAGNFVGSVDRQGRRIIVDVKNDLNSRFMNSVSQVGTYRKVIGGSFVSAQYDDFKKLVTYAQRSNVMDAYVRVNVESFRARRVASVQDGLEQAAAQFGVDPHSQEALDRAVELHLLEKVAAPWIGRARGNALGFSNPAFVGLGDAELGYRVEQPMGDDEYLVASPSAVLQIFKKNPSMARLLGYNQHIVLLNLDNQPGPASGSVSATLGLADLLLPRRVLYAAPASTKVVLFQDDRSNVNGGFLGVDGPFGFSEVGRPGQPSAADLAFEQGRARLVASQLQFLAARPRPELSGQAGRSTAVPSRQDTVGNTTRPVPGDGHREVAPIRGAVSSGDAQAQTDRDGDMTMSDDLPGGSGQAGSYPERENMTWMDSADDHHGETLGQDPSPERVRSDVYQKLFAKAINAEEQPHSGEPAPELLAKVVLTPDQEKSLAYARSGAKNGVNGFFLARDERDGSSYFFRADELPITKFVNSEGVFNGVAFLSAEKSPDLTDTTKFWAADSTRSHNYLGPSEKALEQGADTYEKVMRLVDRTWDGRNSNSKADAALLGKAHDKGLVSLKVSPAAEHEREHGPTSFVASHGQGSHGLKVELPGGTMVSPAPREFVQLLRTHPSAAGLLAAFPAGCRMLVCNGHSTRSPFSPPDPDSLSRPMTVMNEVANEIPELGIFAVPATVHMLHPKEEVNLWVDGPIGWQQVHPHNAPAGSGRVPALTESDDRVPVSLADVSGVYASDKSTQPGGVAGGHGESGVDSLAANTQGDSAGGAMTGKGAAGEQGSGGRGAVADEAGDRHGGDSSGIGSAAELPPPVTHAEPRPTVAPANPGEVAEHAPDATATDHEGGFDDRDVLDTARKEKWVPAGPVDGSAIRASILNRLGPKSPFRAAVGEVLSDEALGDTFPSSMDGVNVVHFGRPSDREGFELNLKLAGLRPSEHDGGDAHVAEEPGQAERISLVNRVVREWTGKSSSENRELDPLNEPGWLRVPIPVAPGLFVMIMAKLAGIVNRTNHLDVTTERSVRHTSEVTENQTPAQAKMHEATYEVVMTPTKPGIWRKAWRAVKGDAPTPPSLTDVVSVPVDLARPTRTGGEPVSGPVDPTEIEQVKFTGLGNIYEAVKQLNGGFKNRAEAQEFLKFLKLLDGLGPELYRGHPARNKFVFATKPFAFGGGKKPVMVMLGAGGKAEEFRTSGVIEHFAEHSERIESTRKQTRRSGGGVRIAVGELAGLLHGVGAGPVWWHYRTTDRTDATAPGATYKLGRKYTGPTRTQVREQNFVVKVGDETELTIAGGATVIMRGSSEAGGDAALDGKTQHVDGSGVTAEPSEHVKHAAVGLEGGAGRSGQPAHRTDGEGTDADWGTPVEEDPAGATRHQVSSRIDASYQLPDDVRDHIVGPALARISAGGKIDADKLPELKQKIGDYLDRHTRELAEGQADIDAAGRVRMVTEWGDGVRVPVSSWYRGAPDLFVAGASDHRHATYLGSPANDRHSTTLGGDHDIGTKRVKADHKTAGVLIVGYDIPAWPEAQITYKGGSSRDEDITTSLGYSQEQDYGKPPHWYSFPTVFKWSVGDRWSELAERGDGEHDIVGHIKVGASEYPGEQKSETGAARANPDGEVADGWHGGTDQKPQMAPGFITPGSELASMRPALGRVSVASRLLGGGPGTRWKEILKWPLVGGMPKPFDKPGKHSVIGDHDLNSDGADGDHGPRTLESFFSLATEMAWSGHFQRSTRVEATRDTGPHLGYSQDLKSRNIGGLAGSRARFGKLTRLSELGNPTIRRVDPKHTFHGVTSDAVGSTDAKSTSHGFRVKGLTAVFESLPATETLAGLLAYGSVRAIRTKGDDEGDQAASSTTKTYQARGYLVSYDSTETLVAGSSSRWMDFVGRPHGGIAHTDQRWTHVRGASERWVPSHEIHLVGQLTEADIAKLDPADAERYRRNQPTVGDEPVSGHDAPAAGDPDSERIDPLSLVARMPDARAPDNVGRGIGDVELHSPEAGARIVDEVDRNLQDWSRDTAHSRAEAAEAAKGQFRRELEAAGNRVVDKLKLALGIFISPVPQPRSMPKFDAINQLMIDDEIHPDLTGPASARALQAMVNGGRPFVRTTETAFGKVEQLIVLTGEIGEGAYHNLIEDYRSSETLGLTKPIGKTDDTSWMLNGAAGWADYVRNDDLASIAALAAQNEYHGSDRTRIEHGTSETIESNAPGNEVRKLPENRIAVQYLHDLTVRMEVYPYEREGTYTRLLKTAWTGKAPAASGEPWHAEFSVPGAVRSTVTQDDVKLGGGDSTAPLHEAAGLWHEDPNPLIPRPGRGFSRDGNGRLRPYVFPHAFDAPKLQKVLRDLVSGKGGARPRPALAPQAAHKLLVEHTVTPMRNHFAPDIVDEKGYVTKLAASDLEHVTVRAALDGRKVIKKLPDRSPGRTGKKIFAYTPESKRNLFGHYVEAFDERSATVEGAAFRPALSVGQEVERAYMNWGWQTKNELRVEQEIGHVGPEGSLYLVEVVPRWEITLRYRGSNGHPPAEETLFTGPDKPIRLDADELGLAELGLNLPTAEGVSMAGERMGSVPRVSVTSPVPVRPLDLRPTIDSVLEGAGEVGGSGGRLLGSRFGGGVDRLPTIEEEVEEEVGGAGIRDSGPSGDRTIGKAPVSSELSPVKVPERPVADSVDASTPAEMPSIKVDSAAGESDAAVERNTGVDSAVPVSLREFMSGAQGIGKAPDRTEGLGSARGDLPPQPTADPGDNGSGPVAKPDGDAVSPARGADPSDTQPDTHAAAADSGKFATITAGDDERPAPVHGDFPGPGGDAPTGLDREASDVPASVLGSGRASIVPQPVRSAADSSKKFASSPDPGTGLPDTSDAVPSPYEIFSGPPAKTAQDWATGFIDGEAVVFRPRDVLIHPLYGWRMVERKIDNVVRRIRAKVVNGICLFDDEEDLEWLRSWALSSIRLLRVVRGKIGQEVGEVRGREGSDAMVDAPWWPDYLGHGDGPTITAVHSTGVDFRGVLPKGTVLGDGTVLDQDERIYFRGRALSQIVHQSEIFRQAYAESVGGSFLNLACHASVYTLHKEYMFYMRHLGYLDPAYSAGGLIQYSERIIGAGMNSPWTYTPYGEAPDDPGQIPEEILTGYVEAGPEPAPEAEPEQGSPQEGQAD